VFTHTHRQTAGLTVRSPTINPSLKNLVLPVDGQSLSANVNPTLHTTSTNSSVIDQLNLYDGQRYSIGGPLLGAIFRTPIPATWSPAPRTRWLGMESLIASSSAPCRSGAQARRRFIDLAARSCRSGHRGYGAYRRKRGFPKSCRAHRIEICIVPASGCSARNPSCS
jgi:hypothetical protein